MSKILALRQYLIFTSQHLLDHNLLMQKPFVFSNNISVLNFFSLSCPHVTEAFLSHLVLTSYKNFKGLNIKV